MTRVGSCSYLQRRWSGCIVGRTRRQLERQRELSLDCARGQLFMSANDPITVMDLDGRYLDANQAACRLLGYTLDELLKHTAQQINHVSDEIWSLVVASTSDTPFRLAETLYFTRDGDAIPVEVNVCRVTYLGHPAILSVARDITRRKEAEAQLVRYNLQLTSLASNAARLARRLNASGPVGTDLEKALATIIDEARRQVPFDSVAVALSIPDTLWLTVYLREESGERVACDRTLVRTPVTLENLPQSQAVLLAGGAVLQNMEEPFSTNGNAASKRGMLIPLRLHERLLGLLSIGRSCEPGFTRLDADTLRVVANQLAVTIDCSEVLDGIRALAISEERSRIAREMHDRVGQTIALASAFSSSAGEMLRDGQVSDAAGAIARASKALQQANGDLRESISAFRCVDASPEQWVEDLRKYLVQYERQWGIQCELQVGDAAAQACGAQGRMGLSRILQEALTNVRKHTKAERASVSIVVDGGSVLARVVDEGPGFDPANTPQGHYGLLTMHERASGLGGELNIASSPNGTQLCVRLPVRCAV